MNDNNRIELLAPAGSYESLIAAYQAGADAVYTGGTLFGARAYADNLNQDQLLSAIDYAHIHSKKLYLTVNTLLKEKEIQKSLIPYLLPFYQHGLDAVIVQDLGVLRILRNVFPDLAIHASTQMTLTGVCGAKMLKALGADRIVTARELSLKEIQQIHNACDIEIESFIHGALCYCYSGQCLFSSMVGGRSGNRGRCAQPCRLPYKTEDNRQYYLMNLKDLCTIDILPEIIEAGVYSLKIEGRMKQPEYTAGVVSIYRRYIDYYLNNQPYQVSEEDRQLLRDLFSRGGFSEGYYKRQNGKSMIFFEGKENKRNAGAFSKIQEKYLNKALQEPITGKIKIIAGEPAVLTIQWKQYEVEVLGMDVEKAQNQPITEDKIKKQIFKTGNTPFVFEKLCVQTDNVSFISVTELNTLRRKALCELEEQNVAAFRRKLVPNKQKDCLEAGSIEYKQIPAKHRYFISVSLEQKKYLDDFLYMEGIDAIYLDAGEFTPREAACAGNLAQQNKKALYYMLPHICRESTLAWLGKHYDVLCLSAITGFVVRNLEELEYLKQKSCKKKIRLDYSVYTFNTQAIKLLQEYIPLEAYTLPLELNSKELKQVADLQSELLIYGRIPMMVSAQCIQNSWKGCSQNSKTLTIFDRYKNRFPVKSFCQFCYNKIYNCKPISLLKEKAEIDKINPGNLRMDFTVETREEAISRAAAFIDTYKKNQMDLIEDWDYTKGHFKRGIE